MRELVEALRIRLDDVDLRPASTFRQLRPDLDRAGATKFAAGFVLQFHAPAGAYARVQATWGWAEREVLFDERLEAFAVSAPHYADLLANPVPLGRTDIYGSGPPVPALSAEVATAAEWLAGNVLDFGCGAGALVAHLRAKGVEASGLELARREVRDALMPEAAPYVSYYDGRLPTGLPSAGFDSVACIEVIEHIKDYSPALDELSRLTRNLLLLTTPDMSAIPILHRHQVVPWHLLEATHVSFFTQASLSAELLARFEAVDLFRIGPNVVNGTTYYTSLLAVCRRPRSVSLLDQQ